MTVKRITDQQKDAVALIYRHKSKTILQLAVELGVSERTIRRILVEKGELPASVSKKPAKQSINYLDVIEYMSLASKEHYEATLASIVHTRIAIKYNISVQAAMLRLEQETINAGKKNESD